MRAVAEPLVLQKIGVLPLAAVLASLSPGGVWHDPGRRLGPRGATIPLRARGSGARIGSLHVRWNTPSTGLATVWRVERPASRRATRASAPRGTRPGAGGP